LKHKYIAGVITGLLIAAAVLAETSFVFALGYGSGRSTEIEAQQRVAAALKERSK
jgi:hypothetical protein